ncbi:RICIN domain-containing protein [Paenibacillus sp. Soil787]|uniref:RICIN domain-containing protein n=1 Tax=Paenibacillus sp. Soil787 TaxID=1736411 RepID=UPI0006FC1316|nr:RICIN domain-containing protein [Paenibacillus sp. Soil787]KRF42904.1 ricin-type beta-trefoil lectin domain protein [Paenibacillus sp. Soil787]
MMFSRSTASMMVRKLTIAFMACVAVFSVFFFDADHAHAVFGPSTMYTPPSGSPSPGALYGRSLRLEHSGSANGTMLATFEQYVNGTPSFPIFRSTDAGKTWTQISSVTDKVNGWGMRWEPFLYELPQAIGNMPAGTILCAGMSIPSDLSVTKLDLYKSTDHGITWSFVSSIATGGEAISTNGHTPIWEPFLLVANNKLIAYYSDQRDPNYGQKIVHQTSTDGVNWGSVVNDVIQPPYANRPGMPVVARMGNGNYIMTYEYGGAPEANFAVYYKITSDPENFGAATGTVLRATDGTVPTSSPYVVWLPTGGPNGTLAVSAYSDGSLFLNTQNGASGTWTKFNSNASSGYSRGLLPMSDGHTLFVISGGPLGGNANSVTYGTVDLGGGISDGAVYKLNNVNSNMVLDINGGSTSQGAAAVQATDIGATDQQWRFNLQVDGFYKIMNIKSGMVLGVTNQSTSNGAVALQWSDNGTPDHEWAVQNTTQGGYLIINKLSGLNLEVYQASTASGATVDQWQDNGGSNQRWNFTQISPPSFTTGQFVITNKNSGKYLDVYQGSTADGATIDQWNDTGYNGQIWTLQATDSGYYRIVNVNSGKVLDVSGASTSAGASIIQWPYYGGINQQWLPVDTGGGNFKLINRKSGMALGIGGGSTSNGATAIQWTDNGAIDQSWQLTRID